jgi:phage-related protein
MFREIIYHKSHFFEFYEAQTEKVKDKIDYVLELIEQVERVPQTFLKHMEGTDGLYEIRVQSGNNIFRIFCFFDAGKLIVLMNGFQKKTDKTPKKEIEKAELLREEYFEEKKRDSK